MNKIETEDIIDKIIADARAEAEKSQLTGTLGIEINYLRGCEMECDTLMHSKSLVRQAKSL